MSRFPVTLQCMLRQMMTLYHMSRFVKFLVEVPAKVRGGGLLGALAPLSMAGLMGGQVAAPL